MNGEEATSHEPREIDGVLLLAVLLIALALMMR